MNLWRVIMTLTILFMTAVVILSLDSAYIMYTNNTLSAQVNGGYPPYSYLWNTNETTQDITNLNPGMYWVVVNDMNFCYTDTLYYDLSSTGISEFYNSMFFKRILRFIML